MVVRNDPVALAQTATEEHRLCQAGMRMTLQHAMAAGDALLAARELCPTGTWWPWLGENCPTIKSYTASRYMRLAANRETVEQADVTGIREAVRLLVGSPTIGHPGQALRDAARQRAGEMRKSGASYKAIGRELGLDPSSVVRMLKGEGRAAGTHRLMEARSTALEAERTQRRQALKGRQDALVTAYRTVDRAVSVVAALDLDGMDPEVPALVGKAAERLRTAERLMGEAAMCVGPEARAA